MDINSINKSPTLIQPSLPERYPPLDHRRYQANKPTPPIKVIPQVKKRPMNPTRLEYSFWSTHPNGTAGVAACLIVSTVIIISVLVIYLTTQKVPIRNCHLNFQRTAKNLLEYNSDPRSVAIGDFNNDTWPDFVVTNAAVNNISVFLASVNGTFDQPTTYPTGPNTLPYKVVVGDWNNDQRLDIAVAYFGSNSIGIFLGLGDGSFVFHTTIFTGSARPIWLHIAHLDDDSFLDLVTADYGTHSISIFSGRGDGNFSYRTTYPTGYDSFPTSIISSDFNEDNLTDLAVANSGTNNMGIFFGTGNGEFSDQKNISTGIHSHPNSIVVGRFNNDTLPDIATANYGSNSITIFLNTGNQTFDRHTTYIRNDASPYAIAVTDFNNDKQSDLVVASRGMKYIVVLITHGSGSFSPAILFVTGSVSSISVAIDDFNKDTLPDLVIVNDNTNSVSIFSSLIDGFQSTATYSTVLDAPFASSRRSSDSSQLQMINAVSNETNVRKRRQNLLRPCGDDSLVRAFDASYFVIVGDFNNDNHVDLAFTYYAQSVLAVSLGYGNGSFANKMIYKINAAQSSLKVIDLNSDGFLDIVAITSYLADTTVLLGYGNGSFVNSTKYGASNFSLSKAQIDFNNDMILDRIVINSNDSISVSLGYGNGSFTRPLLYSTGPIVTDATVGDFNNDHRQDIVVVNRGDNTLRILLGYGNGSFSHSITYLTGRLPQRAAVADFNEDGRSDIVVNNYKENYLNVFIVSQIHFVRTEISSGSGHDSRLQSIAAADFNNDNILDIVVANYGTKTITLLLGQGDGSFEQPKKTALDSNMNPMTIAIGDFDKDNQLDLAVVSSISNSIHILLGDGRGSLRRQSTGTESLSRFPSVMAADDFDHDGRSEIVVAYDDSENIDIFIVYDPISFSKQTTFSTDLTIDSVAMGDLNKDGLLDLVVINSGNDNMDILLGNGDGSFTNQMRYAVGVRPQSVAIGDFNSDTYLDVVITNSNNGIIRILFGTGNGSFENQTTYPTDRRPSLIIVNDFNNDNLSDIVVSYADRASIDILLAYGNGSFAKSRWHQNNSYLNMLVTGYVNNDTFMDIVVFIRFPIAIYTLLGYGNGSFQEPIISPAVTAIFFVSVGDFNNDARLDIVTLDYPSQSPGIFLGYGNGSFTKPTMYTVGCHPTYLTVSDVNNDTHLDIVTASRWDKEVVVILGYGNGSFKEPTKYLTNFLANSIVIGDINNDTRMDIVSIDQQNGSISVLLANFSRVFKRHITLMTDHGSRPQAFATGDFNNDTHPDIAVVNAGTNILGIFLGNGTGSFSTQILSPTASSPSLITAGDLNNDTHLDAVVVSSDHGDISIHLGHGNGSFANYSTFLIDVDCKPKSVSVADFNNDLILDIIIGNSDPSNVVVFVGDGNGNFIGPKKVWTGYGTHPFAVAVGDFNSDKKLDFIVANHETDNLQAYLQTC